MRSQGANTCTSAAVRSALLGGMSSGVLEQRSPTFWGLGTGFMEDSFSTDWGWGEGFGVIHEHGVITFRMRAPLRISCCG